MSNNKVKVTNWQKFVWLFHKISTKCTDFDDGDHFFHFWHKVITVREELCKHEYELYKRLFKYIPDDIKLMFTKREGELNGKTIAEKVSYDLDENDEFNAFSKFEQEILYKINEELIRGERMLDVEGDIIFGQEYVEISKLLAEL